MIKGFFFDLDGTLVDTHRANYEAYRDALAGFEVTLSYEQFQISIGHHAGTFLPWFAPGLTDEQYAQIAELKGKYYQRAMPLTRLNIQLVEFLRAMKPHHAIVLVTTAKRRNANTVLAHHGLQGVFDCAVYAEDVTRSKPDPECYKVAMERTGLKPDEIIVFEDSEPGLVAAKKAGIKAIVRVREFL